MKDRYQMVQKFLWKLKVIGWQKRARVQWGNEGEKEDGGVETDIEIEGRILEVSMIKSDNVQNFLFYIYRKNNANFGMCLHCWPFLRTGSPHRAECMTYKILQRHIFIMKHSVKNHFLHRRACCLYTTVNLQRWSNYRH